MVYFLLYYPFFSFSFLALHLWGSVESAYVVSSIQPHTSYSDVLYLPAMSKPSTPAEGEVVVAVGVAREKPARGNSHCCAGKKPCASGQLPVLEVRPLERRETKARPEQTADTTRMQGLMIFELRTKYMRARLYIRKGEVSGNS